MTTETLQPTVQGTMVTTGRCRASYAYVFQPQQSRDNPSAKPKYRCAFIFPKTDTATKKALTDAIMAAGKAKWGDKFPEMVKSGALKQPLRDGNTKLRDDGTVDPAYKDAFFFNASSENKPQVIDRRRNAVTGNEGFRSGDYCRVNVNAFAYTTVNKGVSLGLNNIQVVERGEALAGGPDALEVFDALPDPGNDGGGSSDPDDLPL